MSPERNSLFDEAWHDSVAARGVYACLVLLFSICVIAGGSARDDVLGVVMIRLVAIVALVVSLLVTPAALLAATARITRYSLSIVLLVAIQLVPLPPWLWRQLPGHLAYANMVEPVVGSLWRPLSMTPDMTINAVLALLPPAAMAVCAALQPRRRRGIMLLAFAGVAVFSGVLGLVQLAAGNGTALRYYPITTDGAAVGVFANRNHHAVFLACAMPAVAAWARMRAMRMHRQSSTRHLTMIVAVACVIFSALAVATGSRFGILAALIGAVGSAAIYRMSSKGASQDRLSTRARLLAIVVSALVVVGGIVVATLPGSAVLRLVTEGPTDEARLTWLAPLWRMIVAFMPFGSGYGSFDSIYRNFEPVDLVRLTYLNAAHNDLAQITIEGGMGALLLLMVFLLWWGRTAVAAWVRPARSSSAIAARTASVIILILLLGSLVDYPLRTPLLACIFATSAVWLTQGEDKIAIYRGQTRP